VFFEKKGKIKNNERFPIYCLDQSWVMIFSNLLLRPTMEITCFLLCVFQIKNKLKVLYLLFKSILENDFSLYVL
jgi:hypothetical protein